MKRATCLIMAALAVMPAHAEEITFTASGSITYITPGGAYLGGRFTQPVAVGDEVKLHYTFESTTPAWQPYADPGYLIYARESMGVLGVKRARIEVAGNVWEFVPCGAPVYCSGRIVINDDYFTGQFFMDLYRVNAVDRDSTSGVLFQVLMDLVSYGATTPVPPLASTALPLTPPDPATFGSHSIRLTSLGNPSYQIDVGEVKIAGQDDAPPRVSGVVASPNPVPVNTELTLGALIDDTAFGESRVVSATFSVDGGVREPMSAKDGSFDAVAEVVTATVAGFGEPGIHDVCVLGMDASGNPSNQETDQGDACTLVVVYDPSGGFVTGGGWIDSAEGMCSFDAVCAEAHGKANFGFVSRYRKGASIPTGTTEFQFSAGRFNFHSESYDWLVVNANGTTAQFKGSGTVNGSASPAGDAYRFMLWARDGGADTDTFRIKIWYVDAGIDIVVYDNSYDQTIGGGNIVVRVK